MTSPISKSVTQGNFYVSSECDHVLNCVLGSCIAACLYDETQTIGGMAHFLLPCSNDRDGKESTKYGAYSMELLINEIMQRGGDKSRLKAKIFGGSQVTKGFSTVGEQNIDFIRAFLLHEGIQIVSENLGGKRARQVRFWPTTGRAQMMLLPNAIFDQPSKTKLMSTGRNEITLF
ncbi:chemotaxis protein CheD [Algirhabdus cladophorae]|uniref:chemotaxis protein CheD n=1 Tax=Algirhabdus cladophorae TaxID=3377108 RepID=UPI003B846882